MPRRPTRRASLAAGLALLVASSVATLPSGAASTGTSVVTLTVPSATTFAPSCGTATSGTSFGTVVPGSTYSTDATCSVTFGSSNDTARLRMYQADGGGDAMWRPPTGPIDTGIGAGTGITTQSVGATDVAWHASEYDPVNDRYYVGGRRNGAIVARYLPNGTLDTLWGGGDGWVVMTMGGGSTDYVTDLELQPDGKVVATGRMFDGGGENDRIGAFRLTAAGAPDPDFGGGDGWVSYDYGDPVGSALALQPDGKVILIGTDAAKGGDGGSYAMRLNTDGSPDTTYGYGDATPADGISFLYQPSMSYVNAIDLDPTTGRAVVAGRFLNGPWVFATWRLLTNGDRDTTWGGDGIGEAGTINYSVSHEVRVHHDGSAFIAGSNGTGPMRSAVVKFASNGTPAPGWGTGGVRQLSPPSSTEDILSAMELLADGSLYVGGWRTSGDSDGYLARIAPSGVVDTSFGSSGYVVSAADAATNDEIASISFGRDGRLVANGTVDLATDRGSFAAWTATSISDYGAGATWQGAGEDAFGACTTAIANAAGTGWAADACSTAADSAAWKGIPDDQASGSIATTASNVQTGAVSIRFGLRTLTTQPPGFYVAPIVLEVVAPL